MDNNLTDNFRTICQIYGTKVSKFTEDRKVIVANLSYLASYDDRIDGFTIEIRYFFNVSFTL